MTAPPATRDLVRIDVVAPGHWRATAAGATPLDLFDHDGTAECRDVDGARFLGYERPDEFRRLVRRLRSAGKLRDVRVVVTVTKTQMPTGGVRETPVEEFRLTRRQLLLAATQSETPRAWQLTEALVELCEKVLDGELVPVASDLPPTLALAQQMLVGLAEQHRRSLALAREQERLAAAQEEQALRLEALEAGPGQLPAGIGAVQLAAEAGWRSAAGNPHNLAVIMACINAGFADDGRLQRRDEPAFGGALRPAWYLTGRGVADFYARIDAGFAAGSAFVVEPTERSCALGHKNRCHVYKRAGNGGTR